jgi:hypothetical protein
MALAILPQYGTLLVGEAVVVAWRMWMTLVLLSWALLATAVARTSSPPGRVTGGEDPVDASSPHPKE